MTFHSTNLVKVQVSGDFLRKQEFSLPAVRWVSEFVYSVLCCSLEMKCLPKQFAVESLQTSYGCLQTYHTSLRVNNSELSDIKPVIIEITKHFQYGMIGILYMMVQ